MRFFRVREAGDDIAAQIFSSERSSEAGTAMLPPVERVLGDGND
jgi:hypothetical protein